MLPQAEALVGAFFLPVMRAVFYICDEVLLMPIRIETNKVLW